MKARRVPLAEQGQVTVLVVGMALVAAAVVGLAIDGTRAYILRRSLQNAADAAALAGASELDQRAFYLAGGRELTLSAARAARAARAVLARRALAAAAHVDAGPGRITVRLRAEAPTSFLALVGIGELPVMVEATSEPVPRPEPSP